tara:strand:- start:244 stop:426 length:183 start_codon:yes stop_codon:yes gene_type:complete
MDIDFWNEVIIGNKPYDIHHYSEDGVNLEVTIYCIEIQPDGTKKTIVDCWEDSFVLSDKK